MSLTLLFDLDDTLLGNDIDTFLPAYLKALGKHLIQHVPPEKMVKELLAATRVMVANNHPETTLEQAFDRAFYPAIGKTKAELRETLEYFYEEIFPSLQPLTSQRPAAVQLVEAAHKAGHTLVVATNPLFPYKAIEHRVHWAGFAPDSDDFALLTTYERFHFSKPNPAYFAEILAQLGWPEQPAVVIGNSLEDDLLPAGQLGLPGYWVSDSTADLPTLLPPLSTKGSLSGVAAWLNRIHTECDRRLPYLPGGLLAILRSTPAALDTLLKDLAPEQWVQTPAPNQWSLTELISHLRDVDREVNMPRIERVIAENNPFLQGIDTDSWTVERNYRQENGPQAFQQYLAARQRLLDQLSSLPDEAWQLPARHAIFGPTTLTELVSFIATHDQSHVRQVVNTLKSLQPAL